MRDLLLAVCVTAIVCGTWFMIGWDAGAAAGWIQVASGQVECRLEEQADKTSKWKCEEKGE